MTEPSSILRLIKVSKVVKEVVILSNSSQHFNSFFLYFLDVNSKHAPTQVETVLTIASEALIGNPTMVTDVLIVETPLAKATEFAPVDACSNLL